MTQWVAQERVVASALRRLIPDHIVAMRQHQSLLAQSIQLVDRTYQGAISHPTRVQVRILARLAAMARIVQLAAERSYELEALALMAPVYELAYSVAFIGQDGSRATAWEKHRDPKVTYPPAKNREGSVRATLLLCGYTGRELRESVTADEKNYHGYCAAKHGNPTLLRHWGLQTRGGKLYVAQGPFLTDITHRQAGAVLGLAARTMYRAIGAFVRPHIELAAPQDLRRFVRAARRAQDRLRLATMRLHIPKKAA